MQPVITYSHVKSLANLARLLLRGRQLLKMSLGDDKLFDVRVAPPIIFLPQALAGTRIPILQGDQRILLF